MQFFYIDYFNFYNDKILVYFLPFFVQVVKDLPFLHPSETEQLKEICKLGSIYKKCIEFVENYSVDLSPVEKFANIGKQKKNQ